MSYHGLKKEKGFIRIHQYYRKHYPYYNTHHSTSIMEQHKALLHRKAHKRSGASTGLNAKQFDVKRVNYCKHFHSRKSIADLIYLPSIQWGFGHHLTLGGNQKFTLFI